MKVRFTATVTKGERLYVAQCVEVDVVSQGETVERSLENLREALELYFEDEPPTAIQDVIVATIDVQLGATHSAA